MKDEMIDKLQKFGLSLYEAKAYAGLLKIGTANAYKISRESGIPRARVYDVLESLAKGGLAMMEESSEGIKLYTPVPSEVFLERVREEWESDYEEVKRGLQDLEMEDSKQDIYVFTVKGKENISAYCRRLIKEADQYVMVSMWNQMYALLLPELEECKSRGCHVLGISHDIPTPLEGMERHFDSKIHNMPENMRWFILSADGKKLLYGYSAEMDKDAFYTEDTSHIYLMEDYILHDMVVNRFIEEEGNRGRMVQIMQEMVGKVSR